MALDHTIQKYPVFLSVMRKGLFWHYLEKSDLRPVVREEYKEPCSHLYIRDKKELLFEVTYYKNRINFEVFHASDKDSSSQAHAKIQLLPSHLTAEFDPLRDEGEEYGKRLKEAGNYVEVHRIKDALHGYFALGIRYFHVQESFELINQFLSRRE